MNPHRDVVIVGAGHGGAQAAIMLRQCGFAGSIALVGDEPELPYERPPLSKDYIAGVKPFEKLLIRSAAFWAERAIEMLPGRYVSAVDPVAKSLAFAEGGGLSYGTLIWSTGGQPRKLSCPGHDLAAVHAVRTRADVQAVMEQLPVAANIVVVGGGYIGLEAAAVLAKLGKQVTVLEACDRVLARVAGPPLSRFYEAEHRRHGVVIRTSATVTGLNGTDGRVTSVRLVEGDTVPADMVIVGIGIIPAVEALAAAGATMGNGVVVDEFCRTSLPEIYAIGDCAAHPSIHAGGAVIRLESVQNANDQASTVAKAITGNLQPYRATPWFWSDQFDLKLQTVGLSAGHDTAIVRGKPEDRSFSVIYLKNGRVIALDCVNNARDYSHGRRLVELGLEATPERLADATAPLKDLLNQ